MTESLKLLKEKRKSRAHLTVEEAIQSESQERFEHGVKKYGQTLDRTDLSTLEWLQHVKEELMDGIRYIERVQRDLEHLTVCVQSMGLEPKA